MSPLCLVAVCSAIITFAIPSLAASVAVWQPPAFGDGLATEPADVIALLSDRGHDVAVISTDDLLDPQNLTPDRYDLLVIPTVGVYPDAGAAVLEDYLRAGGRVMTLGGVPFSRPLSRDGGGDWQLATIPEQPPADVRVIADFEAGVPDRLDFRGDEEGERLDASVVEADGGRALRIATEDLALWEYVELPVSAPDETYTVLRFRAKGDANTTLLGLELNESDQSRWKMVVPLSESWREYRLFIPHFLSYATEDRGGEGDHLHPERLARMSIGFTSGMVGGGAHEVQIDDLELWQFEPPSLEAVPRYRPRDVMTARAYGNLVVMPPAPRSALVALFDDARAIEADALHSTGAATIMPQRVCHGHWRGWTIDVPTDSGPAFDNVAMARENTARLIPLLTAGGGTVAGVIHLHGGDLPNGACAFFALEAGALDSPVIMSAVAETADYLLQRPAIVSFEPTFGVVDGEAAMTLTAQIAAPVEGISARVYFGVTDPGEEVANWTERQEVTLPAGERITLSATVGADEFDYRSFRAAVSLHSAAGPRDICTLTVDTMGTMRALCDFFVERQAEDGTFSNYGYVDERAARGLLALYEMTGDRRYLDAAIRWGDHEIAIQREDGGYRMGYGVRSSGEEACYVADGGEIAIGMVRLLKYVPDDRRDDYLRSLRAYFDYRESFRQPDGRISVGWVFNTKYTTAGGDEVLDEAVRSDLPFGFVCGCTLAATAAWADVTDEPRDITVAHRDARWFLEDELVARSVFAEAAQWAHYFIDDREIRAGFEQRMAETLIPWVAEPDGWWMASAGRGGVTLGAVSYYHHAIQPSPEALAAVMRGLYHTVGDHSPSRLQRAMREDPPVHAEWRYLCYSSVSLAEVLEPEITMRDIDG